MKKLKLNKSIVSNLSEISDMSIVKGRAGDRYQTQEDPVCEDDPRPTILMSDACPESVLPEFCGTHRCF